MRYNIDCKRLAAFTCRTIYTAGNRNSTVRNQQCMYKECLLWCAEDDVKSMSLPCLGVNQFRFSASLVFEILPTGYTKILKINRYKFLG